MTTASWMPLSVSEFAFLCFCVTRLVLVLAFAGRRGVRRLIRPPRTKVYARMSRNTVISGTLALAVALLNGMPVLRTTPLNLRNTLVAAALLAAGMIYDRLEWRLSSARTKQRMWDLLPQNRRERTCWFFGTISAGVCEEIFFRGVLFGILAKIIESPWHAGAIAALVFGIFHLSYGRAAAVGAFLYGVALQCLVQLSGTLYYAMSVHFLHDAIVGLFFGARPPASETQEIYSEQTGMSCRWLPGEARTQGLRR